jgi:UDP-GlcNAc:undecaprenyl-phosphate/decaprenyl-phosphate GlcNAc-1-phosphate transferase
MITYYIAAAFLGSLLTSLALTPVVRRVARQTGFIDKPDGHRKLHVKAVTLGGGLAVQAAVLVTVIAVLGAGVISDAFSVDTRFLVGLLVASAFLVTVGIIDDSVGMRGRYKLACQIVACLVLIAFGLEIRGISVFQMTMEFGWLAIPVTLLWLLGTINAINLLDGADGLAASVGTVLCLTVAALTMFGGHVADGLLAIAIGGALLGFLRYNFAPASIYLGDTGSMFIGFMVGAITIHDNVKGSASLALAAPLCMVAIPMFDSCAALMRRKLTGRSLFAADRGHFHHILQQQGYSVPQTVLIIVGVCLVTSIGALLSFHLRKDVVAIATMVFVIGTLVACRIFGHIEFGLVVHRCMSGLHWRLGGQANSPEGVVQHAYHLYGDCNWNDLWTALSESAETFGLIRIEFRILMPSICESFYGVWAKPSSSSDEEQWSIKSPLFFNGQLAGNLALTGHASKSAIQAINVVTDFLEPIEDHIKNSISDLNQRADTATFTAAKNDQDQQQRPVQGADSMAAAVATSPSSSFGHKAHKKRYVPRQQPV